MSISWPKFFKRVSRQKGGIFGFRKNPNNDTGSVLKISQLEEYEKLHLYQGKVPIHNIGLE